MMFTLMNIFNTIESVFFLPPQYPGIEPRASGMLA